MEADLKMHPDTDNPALNGLVMIGMMYVTDGDKAACSTGSKVFNDRGQKRLGVQSRHLVERVQSESLRLGCPSFPDELVGVRPLRVFRRAKL
jgi:hypothetical protein